MSGYDLACMVVIVANTIALLIATVCMITIVDDNGPARDLFGALMLMAVTITTLIVVVQA